MPPRALDRPPLLAQRFYDGAALAVLGEGGIELPVAEAPVDVPRDGLSSHLVDSLLRIAQRPVERVQLGVGLHDERLSRRGRVLRLARFQCGQDAAPVRIEPAPSLLRRGVLRCPRRRYLVVWLCVIMARHHCPPSRPATVSVGGQDSMSAASGHEEGRAN